MDYDQTQTLTHKAKESMFSGIISIEVDDNIKYTYIDGVEDRTTKEPITRNTLCAVASGTKFLTALAIGQLIDERKLSLDTKAKDVYDLNMDWVNPNITIRQLLSHTSGMADYLDEDLIDDTLPTYFDIPYESLVNPKDFIPIFSKDKEKFCPGEKFNYNNQAYVYLAIIIEEVSQKSYQDYINNHVLKPIHIHRSGIYHMHHYPLHTAIGYLDHHETSLSNVGLLPYQAGGDGGAIFSVDDMKLLWEAFFNYKIISKTLVEQYTHIHAVFDETTHNYYGLGLWLKKENDVIYPYLLGGDPGISFTSSYEPKSKTFMFAISNTSEGVWTIFDEFLILTKKL